MSNDESSLKWYEGITKYQWLVLLIASLGWVFDVFEGQIFVASMTDAMPALLTPEPGIEPAESLVSTLQAPRHLRQTISAERLVELRLAVGKVLCSVGPITHPQKPREVLRCAAVDEQ